MFDLLVFLICISASIFTISLFAAGVGAYFFILSEQRKKKDLKCVEACNDVTVMEDD
eukprot:Pgem_evm1s7773